MPESHWDPLLAKLRESQKQIALVFTGGGAGAISRCFRREGASSNFVEAVIPYSRAALNAYLGAPSTHPSASAPITKQLAAIAHRRAECLADRKDAPQATGLALTAALPTTPMRRGADRIHVALQTSVRGIAWSLEWTKENESRESAETLAEEMVFNSLAELIEHPTREQLFETSGLRLQRMPFDVQSSGPLAE